MSIPERFYRIARFKLHEIKDRIERWDAESQVAPEFGRTGMNSDRVSAIVELDQPRPLADLTAPRGSAPVNSVAADRSAPQGGSGTGRSQGQSQGDYGSYTSNPDPLLYHYRLLGLDPGQDFSAVQDAYAKLSARADPLRFPAGSVEARQAEEIRVRLEASFRALRDALDPTARRFDLLEFDSDKA